MSQFNVVLAANVGSKTLLRKATKPRHAEAYGATIMASGTFGGGTLSFFMSPDGGTTFIALQDSSGNNTALTAAGDFNVVLFVGNSLREKGIGIYYTLSGATSPNISLSITDNKG